MTIPAERPGVSYLVKCTWSQVGTVIYVGPFSAKDSAEEFASDPRASRYRLWVNDRLADNLFQQYEREVVQVFHP